MAEPRVKRMLTVKQEKFCLEYLKTGNASEAYRRAYGKKGKSDKSINELASHLLKNIKVASRVAALRAPVIARAQYGLEQAMEEAETARRLAMLMGHAAAAVSAVALKAKLNGLLVEDRQNERRPLQDVDDAELDRQIKHDAKAAGVSVTLH